LRWRSGALYASHWRVRREGAFLTFWWRIRKIGVRIISWADVRIFILIINVFIIVVVFVSLKGKLV
jgi:hypothetical protein